MIRKISNILIAIILVTVIGLLLILGIPLIRKQKMYVVQTGSMLPVYPINSVVVVQPMLPEDIKVGDDITFEGLSDGTLVTHRVMEDHPEDRQFITKGTNNRVEDLYPTDYDSLIGKVVYHIPYIGILAATLQSTSGKIIAGCFLIFVMILLILPELFEPSVEEEEEEEKKASLKKTSKKAKKIKQLKKTDTKGKPPEVDINIEDVSIKSQVTERVVSQSDSFVEEQEKESHNVEIISNLREKEVPAFDFKAKAPEIDLNSEENDLQNRDLGNDIVTEEFDFQNQEPDNTIEELLRKYTKTEEVYNYESPVSGVIEEPILTERPQIEEPALVETPYAEEPAKLVYKAPVPQIDTEEENSPFDDFPPFLQDEDIHHQ